MSRDYSHHQQGLIRNFYRNREAIDAQRLQEIVTDIYLAGTGKKADRLWQRVKDILGRVPNADADALDALVAARDIEALARIAGARFDA